MSSQKTHIAVIYGSDVPSYRGAEKDPESVQELLKLASENQTDDLFHQVGWHRTRDAEGDYFWFGVAVRTNFFEGFHPLSPPDESLKGKVLDAWWALPLWVRELIGHPRLYVLVSTYPA